MRLSAWLRRDPNFLAGWLEKGSEEEQRKN